MGHPRDNADQNRGRGGRHHLLLRDRDLRLAISRGGDTKSRRTPRCFPDDFGQAGHDDHRMRFELRSTVAEVDPSRQHASLPRARAVASVVTHHRHGTPNGTAERSCKRPTTSPRHLQAFSNTRANAIRLSGPAYPRSQSGHPRARRALPPATIRKRDASPDRRASRATRSAAGEQVAERVARSIASHAVAAKSSRSGADRRDPRRPRRDRNGDRG